MYCLSLQLNACDVKKDSGISIIVKYNFFNISKYKMISIFQKYLPKINLKLFGVRVMFIMKIPAVYFSILFHGVNQYPNL